jgi:uroporphyrinogen-III synthase
MDRIAYVGAPLDQTIPDVIEISVLKIQYLDISGIGTVRDPLVLTSKRGVISLKMSSVKIESKRAYCIGDVTARYMKEIYGMECAVPAQQNSMGLAELVSSREKKVEIVSSDSISRKFIEKLEDAGIAYRYTIAYMVVENENVDYSLLAGVKRIVVGSPRSFQIISKRASGYLEGKEIYAIGIPTYNEIISSGFRAEGHFDKPDIVNIIAKLKTQR